MGVATSSCFHRSCPDRCFHREGTIDVGAPFAKNECLNSSSLSTCRSTLVMARGAHGDLRMLDEQGAAQFVCKGLDGRKGADPKPVTICDAAGEPLCLVERVEPMATDATFRVLIKGEPIAAIASNGGEFIYSVRGKEALAVSQSVGLQGAFGLLGRQLDLKRGVGGPCVGSMVGSLGAPWTITTAPGVDLLAVLSLFVALTCMGGLQQARS